MIRFRPMALALFILAAGCTPPGVRPPAALDRAASAPAAHDAGGRWIACQLHAHSRRSGFATERVADLAAQARAAGIEALAVTDHDAVAQNAELAGEPGLIALKGTEWTSPDKGHAGVYGFTGDAPFDPALTPAALLAAAERRGGLVVVNHPRDGMFGWQGEGPGSAAAVEVWNATYGYSGARPGGEGAATWEALHATSPAPGTELRLPTIGDLRTMLFTKNVEAIAWWLRALRQGARVAPTGGSDFHRWPQALDSPITFVWARTPDAAGVLAGLRAGRTMIAGAVRAPRVELLGDADGDGRFEAMVGDTIRCGPATRFRLRVTGGHGLTASLSSHGGEVFRATVQADEATIDVPATIATHGFVWARLDGGLARGYLQAMTAALYLAD
jgi:hypothetical protein